ncbi:MAG: asparagine--tRNA ligase [Planctomycetes bacterium]|nr:asparagine--tRNA ligase [Planctomycetota bacterium]
MTHVNIKDLNRHIGEEVRLQGWAYRVRSSGKVAFLLVRDGTGLCQCVVEKSEQTSGFFDTVKRLPQESSLRVTGTVRAEERAEGGYELAVTGFELIHASGEYPITPKAHGTDFLMKHRHLWLRSRRQEVILKIRHTLVDAIRRFFNDNGFTLIDTPIFAPSAGEGASTLFEVDYFGEPVYLAQTGQLYLESACMSHGKVYCFGPTFRAEKSKTRRHLTEFWMVEPEVAFADLDDVMAIAEDFIMALVSRVLNDHRTDLEFLGRDVAKLAQIRKPFVRLSYSDAVDVLHSALAKELLEEDLQTKTARIEQLEGELESAIENVKDARKKWEQEKAAQREQAIREELSELREQVGNIPHHMELAAGFEWGKDLGGSDETIISRLHDQPVLCHRYPKGCKAFYMKLDPDDKRVVKNFDVLAPEGFGEIIGGSQREDDYDVLLGRIEEEGLAVEPFEWYLDLRRYGSVPHGGFGLGVERTLAWLCGLDHIRETIPFARMMGKIYP